MAVQKFPGKYSSLSKICKLVGKCAKDAGLDDKDTYSVQLAVDEACSNIIEHGYGGEGIGDIEFNCEKTDDGLIVTIRDESKKFNPGNITKPDINIPLEKLSIRGAGLFLIHSMMDEVDFKFNGGGNVLRMKKKKSGS
jgi:serine/threonine-protein kinase RsbW